MTGRWWWWWRWWSLSLLLLVVVVTGNNRDSNVNLYTFSVHENLDYSVITPTETEFRDTFNNTLGTRDFGPVHLWLNCVGVELRAYYVIDFINHSHDIYEHDVRMRMDKVLKNYIKVYVNDEYITSAMTTYYGGEFIIDISKYLNQEGSMIISIRINNWGRFTRFNLHSCRKNVITKEATTPRFIMNIVTAERVSSTGMSLSTDVATIARHLLYHKCVLDIVGYEIVTQYELISHFMTSGIIRNAVINNLLTFYTKQNQPTQLGGTKYRLLMVYTNLRILSLWRQNSIRLFFIDPDEYIVINQYMVEALKRKLYEHDVVLFQRKTVICKDCNGTDSIEPIVAHKFLQSDLHLPSKVAIDVDRAGLMLVHFAQRYTNKVRIHAREAYLMHFDNFFFKRIDPINDDKFNFYEVSMTNFMRCDANTSGIPTYMNNMSHIKLQHMGRGVRDGKQASTSMDLVYSMAFYFVDTLLTEILGILAGVALSCVCVVLVRPLDKVRGSYI